MSKLTPEEQAALRSSGIFGERSDKLCTDCGGYHLAIPCRRIKRQVWLGNGNRTEVEYWQDGAWDESGVIYPDDVFEESDDDA